MFFATGVHAFVHFRSVGFTLGRTHSTFSLYHGGREKMIANQGFLFRPPLPAQNKRDLAKDTRILENGHDDFLV